MTVVSAIGENPPGNAVRKGEAPHWTLLSSGGGDGMRTAETALRRYGPRRRIGERFRALRTGTGIRDRRPDAAGDLRGCLAFDAMTAVRVRDLQLPARESPDSPAERHVSPESGGAVVIHAAYGRVIGQRAPPEPDMTVARHLTPVAGLAGFRPTKRQPMPGPYGPGRSGEGNEPVRYVVVTGPEGPGQGPVKPESAGFGPVTGKTRGFLADTT